MIGLGDASVQRGMRQTELVERLVLDKMQERLNMQTDIMHVHTRTHGQTHIYIYTQTILKTLTHRHASACTQQTFGDK